MKTVLPVVALNELSPVVGTVELGLSSGVEVVSGPTVSDANGPRRTVAFVNPEMSMTYGEGIYAESLPAASMRITELSLGADYKRHLPGVLPEQLVGVHAVELTVQEGLERGVEDLRFSEPVPIYVDNYLGQPVGVAVQTAHYDVVNSAWVPQTQGVVLEVLSVESSLPELDTDGDGIPDSAERLELLGFTEWELAGISETFVAGDTFIRFVAPHFSTWAFGWPADLPATAVPPAGATTAIWRAR